MIVNHTPAPPDGSTIFVTIPCYDEPDLIGSLNSLAACDPPNALVTVIVAVNASDQTSEAVVASNSKTISQVMTWWKGHSKPFFQLRLLEAPSLPAKWAGVGWGRKIAMDEAIHCLYESGKEDGILAAFDADSRVTPNYLKAIESAFKSHPRYHFVNLNFSHPIEDQSLTPSLREGIILYELYLRYLRLAMQWCGYPHSIHTIGSSFAVKASAYVKQGGMNRRQAGEDFHFLHKIVMLGDYGLVKEATVFPAARISHRVPFGTGAALKKWEEGDPQLNHAYALSSFRTLQPLFKDPGWFFDTVHENWGNQIGKLDPFLQNYLSETGTIERLIALKKNCSDVRSFTRRFYHEVNAFWIIQYLNQRKLSEGSEKMVMVEAEALLKELNITFHGGQNAMELLTIFRRLDLQ